MTSRRPLAILASLLLVLTALGTAACASRTINHVLADPSRYRYDSITLSGTVLESFSLADRGAYELEDRTGRLWVVSDRGVPRRGARVKVTGTVREAFNLGPLGGLIRLPTNGVVLIESSRKADD